MLALTVNGESRAYPTQILTWHEIVNDTVAGIPVAVIYCPLCNSGVAFDRRVGSRTLTLSRSTGFDRDYGRNPYLGYDEADKPLFDAPGEDPRLPALERVVAIPGQRETIAVVRASVTGTGVRTITIDGRSLVVWHRPGQASALEDADVAAGRDIGTVAVFEPVAGGRPLTFKAAGTGFVDAQTGTRWNILGRATSGQLAGSQLSAYPFIETFWFTWIAFQPDTQLIR